MLSVYMMFCCLFSCVYLRGEKIIYIRHVLVVPESSEPGLELASNAFMGNKGVRSSFYFVSRRKIPFRPVFYAALVADYSGAYARWMEKRPDARLQTSRS